MEYLAAFAVGVFADWLVCKYTRFVSLGRAFPAAAYSSAIGMVNLLVVSWVVIEKSLPIGAAWSLGAGVGTYIALKWRA